MSDNWKQTLSAVAPVLASAIAGPMAGVAVKALASQFLDNDNATEDDIAQAITSSSPADLARLKEIDGQFKKDMAQLGIDLEKIAAADRQDARQMARSNMLPQIILSSIYTLGYVGVLYVFVGGDVQIADSAKTEFSIVLGVLTAAQAQIMNFFFGSSAGSKEKTGVLNRG